MAPLERREFKQCRRRRQPEIHDYAFSFKPIFSEKPTLVNHSPHYFFKMLIRVSFISLLLGIRPAPCNLMAGHPKPCNAFQTGERREKEKERKSTHTAYDNLLTHKAGGEMDQNKFHDD